MQVHLSSNCESLMLDTHVKQFQVDFFDQKSRVVDISIAGHIWSCTQAHVERLGTTLDVREGEWKRELV